VRIALTLSLLLLAALAPAAQAASKETRIIVARDPGLSGAERTGIRHDAGVDLVRRLRVADAEVVTTEDPRAALAALRSDPNVRSAEIVRTRHAFTNDPAYVTQWALENTGDNLSANFIYPDGSPLEGGTVDADMDVLEAWAHGATGAGVTVAVVDSGITADHPDLTGQLASGSTGFVGGANSDFADGEGHGTHVAGIIAATRDNEEGITGIAPDAKIMAVKALDQDGMGTDPDVIDALDYAGDQHVRIVNASLGGDGASSLMTQAITSHPGTLYVVAAGNGGTDGIGDDNDASDVWPCNAPADNVICVGASNQDDEPASFSNFGRTTVDLFAPGQWIFSTLLSGYGLDSGTSMASPAVAAEAALVLSAAPSLTTKQLKSILLDATDGKAAFACRTVSSGRANAALAVGMAGSPPASTSFDCDGDGVADSADGCPTQYGPTANGCPAPTGTTQTPVAAPTPAPAPVANPGDADHDGRADALDLCPNEAASTTTGCPLPGVRSVSVKAVKAKHRATIRIRTTRSATVAVRVERRVCNAKGKRCKWRKAYSATRASKANAATFSVRKLSRGRYRVTVKLSSPAGSAKQVSKAFKV
jgi:subtilisin family serine protease